MNTSQYIIGIDLGGTNLKISAYTFSQFHKLYFGTIYRTS